MLCFLSSSCLQFLFFLQSSDSEKTKSQTKKSPAPHQPSLLAFFLGTLSRYYKAISKAILQGGNQRRTASILLGSSCASHRKRLESQQGPERALGCSFSLSAASCLGNSLFPDYPLVGCCWQGITCACSKVPAWGVMQPPWVSALRQGPVVVPAILSPAPN